MTANKARTEPINVISAGQNQSGLIFYRRLTEELVMVLSNYPLYFIICLPLSEPLTLDLYYRNVTSLVTKRNAIPLFLCNVMAALVVDIKVGAPWQEFSVEIDFSSDLLFLPLKGAEKLFDQNSETLMPLFKPFSKPIHDGFSTGFVYQDILYVGERYAGVVPLGLSKKHSPTLFNMPRVQGYLGLAPASSTDEVVNGILDILIRASGQVQSCFTLSFTRQLPRQANEPDAKLEVGSCRELVEGANKQRAALAQNDKWMIHLHEIKVGEEKMHVPFYRAEFTTRTPYILTRASLITSYNKALNITDERRGIYYVACSFVASLPAITFHFGTTVVSLTSAQYIHKFHQNGKEVCASPFAHIENKEYNHLLLGTVFLQNFETVFDKKRAAVYLYPA